MKIIAKTRLLFVYTVHVDVRCEKLATTCLLGVKKNRKLLKRNIINMSVEQKRRKRMEKVIPKKLINYSLDRSYSQCCSDSNNSVYAADKIHIRSEVWHLSTQNIVYLHVAVEEDMSAFVASR